MNAAAPLLPLARTAEGKRVERPVIIEIRGLAADMRIAGAALDSMLKTHRAALNMRAVFLERNVATLYICPRAAGEVPPPESWWAEIGPKLAETLRAALEALGTPGGELY